MGFLLAGFYLSVEIREDERDGMCLVGEKRNTYRVLVGKPERKRTPGRPRHTCENGSGGSMCEGAD
jgi:hypothetical protein